MKPYYNSAKMNYLNNWCDEDLYSCASKVENRLNLLKRFESIIKEDKVVGLIVITENNSETQTDINLYPKQNQVLNFGPLRIKRIRDSFFEINTIPSQELSLIEISQPNRSAHKISEIKPGKTIRYRTNHKYDTWGTTRGQRSFLKQDYIVQHLGFVNEINFSLNEKNKVNLKIDKLVNERKLLK